MTAWFCRRSATRASSTLTAASRRWRAVSRCSAATKGTTAPIPRTPLTASKPAPPSASILQARDDYGYAGDATLGPIGKAIIAKFYGEPPARSYMFGCSNGGRHAMVAASRLGDQYDGFVAGDPGFNLPRAAIQHAWDVQSFQMIDPDVKKSFAPADMALISRKVLEACDKLDGVEDGMVGDIKACQKAFHLADLHMRRREDRSMPGEGSGRCADPRLRRPAQQQRRAALFGLAF